MVEVEYNIYDRKRRQQFLKQFGDDIAYEDKEEIGEYAWI